MTDRNNDSTSSPISLDQPLSPGDSLRQDKLGRKDFADAAARTLRSVGPSAGIVLSIEGAWGSGKTSTLAMVEDLLRDKSHGNRPVVVHFNPWLVGERDALLRQFLSKLASAVKLTDHAKDGKRVAKELKTYARAFDVLKLVPGAEPWASMVKSVVHAVGESTGAIADYKAPDIEGQKAKVEAALKRFPNPIVVFVDDIDRLFPLEVFEMVRIIKAVGDFPNVGYAVAWDASYVSLALEKAGVPRPASYLDKIVQVRMPLPSISHSARVQLINEAVATLHPSALSGNFAREEERLSLLYFSGLRELLEQPRDVTRVFNTVKTIEPALRGEVTLSDIVGLAALMVMAPAVFELLRRHPRWFVGQLPDEPGLDDKPEEILKEGTQERESAYAKCAAPLAAQRLVHRLFPLLARIENGRGFREVVDVEGHIAAPARLLVALSLSASASDVSLVASRRYLLHPMERVEIERSLTPLNCFEFVESLGDVVNSLRGRGISDPSELCLAIARLVDKETFVVRHHGRKDVFSLRPAAVALRAIAAVVETVGAVDGSTVAARVAMDGESLTVAAEIVADSLLTGQFADPIRVQEAQRDDVVDSFAQNCLLAAEAGDLLRRCMPDAILWTLASVAKSEKCRRLFDALQRTDPSLDGFALEMLKHGYDSNKGQIYSLGDDPAIVEAYSPLDELREHAEGRLLDSSLTFPARAAWQSLLEGKRVYGVDGSFTSR